MNTITKLMAAATLAASGCTMPNVQSEVTLDGPAVLYAWGPTPGSHIEVKRQGAIDPDGHMQDVPVTDARVTIDLGQPLRVTRLDLGLSDVDLPASPQVPEGLQLRAQKLTLDATDQVTTLARSFDTLEMRVDGTLDYRASLPIPDGLYPLGATQVTGTLDVDVHQSEDGQLHVWLSAAPSGTCGEVGSIMTLSQCALAVELTGVDTVAK